MERFSENKYSMAAYTAVFSLEVFCCILYDVVISPAVSELPCAHHGVPECDMKDKGKGCEPRICL